MSTECTAGPHRGQGLFRLAAPPSMAGMLALAACARPTSLPPSPIPVDPEPGFTTTLYRQSTCRTVSITHAANGGMAVEFPRRASCSSDVVVIPGGTIDPSWRSADAARIPIRLLNQLSFPIRLAATQAHEGTDRASQDSWVWRREVSSTLAADDSTATTMLTVPLVGPSGTTKVSVIVVVENRLRGRWRLISSQPVPPDTSKVAIRPGTPSATYYRVDAVMAFRAGVSDDAKQAFFVATGVTPRAVTRTEVFFIRIPDVGPSINAIDALLESLRARSEVDYLELMVKPDYPGGPPGT